jgi:hypothetical protein
LNSDENLDRFTNQVSFIHARIGGFHCALIQLIVNGYRGSHSGHSASEVMHSSIKTGAMQESRGWVHFRFPHLKHLSKPVTGLDGQIHETARHATSQRRSAFSGAMA